MGEVANDLLAENIFHGDQPRILSPYLLTTSPTFFIAPFLISCVLSGALPTIDSPAARSIISLVNLFRPLTAARARAAY